MQNKFVCVCACVPSCGILLNSTNGINFFAKDRFSLGKSKNYESKFVSLFTISPDSYATPKFRTFF